MKIENSCGAILFKIENNVRKYVLVLESDGHYGFPKGHMEDNESMLDTATREVLEETGVNALFIPNLKRTIKYNKSKDILKVVTYFVAKFDNQDIIPLDKNIVSAKAYPLDVALNLLSFDELKNILIETDYMLDLRGNK